MTIAKRCAFCGEAGKSGEHIWPQWMKDYVPAKNVGHDILRYRQDGIQHDHRSIGFDVNWQTNRVCGSCNSGWMSRLQDHASALLKPLIDGEDIEASADDIGLLNSWIAMAVMVYELVDVKSVCISPEHRRWLMDFQVPPPGWHFFAGRAKSKERNAFHRAAFLYNPLTLDETEIHVMNAQMTVMQVGHCLFVASSCSDQLEIPMSLRLDHLLNLVAVAPGFKLPPEEITDADIFAAIKINSEGICAIPSSVQSLLPPSSR